MSQIQQIESETLKLRTELANHKLYDLLSNEDDIRIFMEKHVLAVWDFMSLLKALQSKLTCTSIPWKPVKNAKTARFINEIVFGEESDLNEKGVPNSHFQMYLEAMQEVGANPKRATDLIDSIHNLEDVSSKISSSDLKPAEKSFLNFTFDTIKSGDTHKIASAFTYGREDLIPSMFIAIIKKSGKENQSKFPKLTYYLERHIEVDGDEHGPLSLEMIAELCGDNTELWQDALTTAKGALRQRINLWNEIADELEKKNSMQKQNAVGV
ncbi:MAG: DUF3050 domain-containing protein [Saprospiraceae bacterium]